MANNFGDSRGRERECYQLAKNQMLIELKGIIEENKKDLISELRSEEMEFDDEAAEILKKYKAGDDEPLDGDEVDRLIEHLRQTMNLLEGNITREEYIELIN